MTMGIVEIVVLAFSVVGIASSVAKILEVVAKETVWEFDDKVAAGLNKFVKISYKVLSVIALNPKLQGVVPVHKIPTEPVEAPPNPEPAEPAPKPKKPTKRTKAAPAELPKKPKTQAKSTAKRTAKKKS